MWDFIRASGRDFRRLERRYVVHGGLAGTALAIYSLQAQRISVLSLADVCAAAVPIGLFSDASPISSSRNFGGAAGVPGRWFSGAGPLPRHLSQLYEAGLEGFVLFLVLFFAVHWGRCGARSCHRAFCRRLWYRANRMRIFREPDPAGLLFGARPWACFVAAFDRGRHRFIILACRRPAGRGMNTPA
jgi:phosphatidylglycerol:prolipoprotein diacylglycerol transferase